MVIVAVDVHVETCTSTVSSHILGLKKDDFNPALEAQEIAVFYCENILQKHIQNNNVPDKVYHVDLDLLSRFILSRVTNTSDSIKIILPPASPDNTNETNGCLARP